MGDLSTNFSRWEFACKCGCGFDAVDVELLDVLMVVRRHFGKKVTIESGNRCGSHNSRLRTCTTHGDFYGDECPFCFDKGKQRSSDISKHLIAKAADIRVATIPPKHVYEFLCEVYPGKYGIGLYSTWVHIDVRSEKARW